jgi:hypothetical protein
MHYFFPLTKVAARRGAFSCLGAYASGRYGAAMAFWFLGLSVAWWIAVFETILLPASIAATLTALAIAAIDR